MKRKGMIGILLNVLVPIIIITFFLLLLQRIMATSGSTYVKFDEVVNIARQACSDPGQEYALTELVIDPGVFIKQVYNSSACKTNLLNLAGLNKFSPYCKYTCHEGETCLCIGRTSAAAYGYLVYDLRESGEAIPTWNDVKDDVVSRCAAMGTLSLPIEDESLCCASLGCYDTSGLAVFVFNSSVGVFDGLYCPSNVNGYRIQGIFKMLRSRNSDYYINLYVE